MPCALWVLGWVSENWDPLKGTWRLPCVTFSGRGVTNAMLILMSFLFVHVSCLWFFTSMHVLNFLFWVRVICINNEIGTIVWFRIIILRSPEKGAQWKFWLDPRFSWNFKPKWTLKWLPLDRGYFKFYFHKGENILVISCHTYLLTRNFVILFQVIFVLPCILFLVKMSHNFVLLINNPSKRGDVKTLARSSVSPSSQVKMKLKLTASR